MSTVLVRNATRDDYADLVREISGLFHLDLRGKSVLDTEKLWNMMFGRA